MLSRAAESWAASAVADGAAPLDVVAAAGRVVAAHRGLAPEDGPSVLARRPQLDAPVDELDVDHLPVLYEFCLSTAERRAAGVHYTPTDVAQRLSDIAIGGGCVSVCDPAAGGGAFLLAAARVLERTGAPRARIVRGCLWGADVDADAVEVAQLTLGLWAGGPTWVSPGAHMVVADTLERGSAAFADVPEGGFDVVVGNPPFLGQLEDATARGAAEGRRLRERWDVDAGPYADTAAYFLLASHELLRAGGRQLIIQPQSVLASADVEPIREFLGQAATLEGMWIADDGVFAAAVSVCAVPAAEGTTTRPGSGGATVGRSLRRTDRRLHRRAPDVGRHQR